MQPILPHCDVRMGIKLGSITLAENIVEDQSLIYSPSDALVSCLKKQD